MISTYYIILVLCTFTLADLFVPPYSFGALLPPGHEGLPPESLASLSTHSLSLPRAYDFRSAHASCEPVIKDQGQCGSCYAFAALYSISARLCIKESQHIQPSEMEIVRCAVSDGCFGALYTDVSYYGYYHGIRSDECYPYEPVTHQKCLRKGCSEAEEESNPVVWLANTEYMSGLTTLETIKKELIENGPVSITIPIYRSFMFYTGGVWRKKEDDSFEGYHAVNVVAYDDDLNTLTLSNSWGRGWGEQGYAVVDALQPEMNWGIGVMAFEPSLTRLSSPWIPYIVIGVVVVLIIVCLILLFKAASVTKSKEQATYHNVA
ncbi:hypothetical protein RCL1_001232 [Eukaryota sp. TZLM3-RCL]